MHTALWIVFFIIIFAYGGLAGRIRGSGLFETSFTARFGVWGGSVSLLVLAATLNPYYALAALAMAGIGASSGYWGDFNLTIPQTRTWRNFFKLSVMGCYRFVPLFALSLYSGDQWKILPAVIAGLSFYPAYRLGVQCSYHISPKLKFEGKYLLDEPSSWGEFFFWGTIYLALGLGLFFG